MFKILNSYHQIDSKDIFASQKDRVTRGHLMKLFKPRVCSSIGQHFFSFRVVQQWDDLPDQIVLAKTSSFKCLLDKYWRETGHGHGHNQRPLAY